MAKRIKFIKHISGSAIFCAACLFVIGCTSRTTLSDSVLEKGVSKELADWRKANLSNLCYQLEFYLSEKIEDAVTGNVTIFVDKADESPLVIDFRGDAKQIISVSANDKTECSYDFCNEHIILSSDDVCQGTNKISINFIAGDQSLNRNHEYLYTLLVPDRARTLFPCFDQPNLKAKYTLTLEVPTSWVAISNTPIDEQVCKENRHVIRFMPTEPLSTYLFSFVAGKFQKETQTHGSHTISAYYRETDPKRLAQLDTIFQQVFSAIQWLEDYTDIPYPFAKYDFIILPGFQYGGMEHTGATLYNDRRMFLNEHPTPDEELSRAQLIAHETAHMWFGDYVTMDWFNDVWTKEVFANYFASRITEPLFPHINHSLNNLRTFQYAAMSEDRTKGTTSIQQPLSNLQDAGLIYGQIIYNKAPVVMLNMADMLGEKVFQKGVRSYLQKHAYSNATWDDLIEILDGLTDIDMKRFSQSWVKEKAMPTISLKPVKQGITILQKDPLERNLLWPQEFSIQTLYQGNSELINVNLKTDKQTYPLLYQPEVIIPNTNGKGYGFFAMDEQSLSYLAEHWSILEDDLTRQSVVMTLYENYLNHQFSSDALIIHSFIDGLKKEKNPLIASSIIRYLNFICTHISGDLRIDTEESLASLGETFSNVANRLQIQRLVYTIMTSPKLINNYYQMWKKQSNPLWSENDYTTLAYELAIRLPNMGKEILAEQRSRISNPDRLQQFDFISRACSVDTLQMDTFFQELSKAENRKIEPYATTALHYLNHALRDKYAIKYIRPGLELLKEIQHTGDIFFPSNWVRALLESHRNEMAYHEVQKFLQENPNYPILLKNKILQAVYPLEWKTQQK